MTGGGGGNPLSPALTLTEKGNNWTDGELASRTPCASLTHFSACNSLQTTEYFEDFISFFSSSRLTFSTIKITCQYTVTSKATIG